MADNTISIPGVGPDYRVPGDFLQILMGQGPGSLGIGQREVMFIMPKTSTGTGTVNKRYAISSEAQAIDVGGYGSPLHIGIRKFLQSNSTSKVWAVPYAATSGGTPVSATVSVIITGVASGRGTATIWVCGEPCTYSFATSAAAATVAQGLVDSINAKPWLPVAATLSTATVVITAKIAGASQNIAICTHTEITPGVTTTIGAGGDLASGAEGTTTEATNFAAALTAQGAVDKYFLVTSLYDATNLGAFKSAIALKSDPNPGLRCVGIAATRDTYANTATIAIGLNYNRMQIAMQTNSEWHPAQIAGLVAAIRAKFESDDPSFNFAGFAGPEWTLPKVFDESKWPTASTTNDGILDGITVITSSDAGSRIAMSVSTASKNAAGTMDDFRQTETHRTSVADYIASQIHQMWWRDHSGKKLKDDERLPNGTVNPSQIILRSVTTPWSMRRSVIDILRTAAAAGHLQNVDASIASLILQRSSVNNGRVEMQCDIRATDHNHQLVGRISEVSPG